MLKSIYEKCLVAGMLLVMVSCAHKLIMSEITPGSGVTKDFVAFLQSFNSLASNSVDGYCQMDVDVGFGNLKNIDPDNKGEGNVIGVCIPTSRPMILFDRQYWESASPIEREMLAYHEFGHCLLDLEHNEKMMNLNGRQRPESLMYPSIFSQYWYMEMQDYYLAELFHSTKLTPENFKETCPDGKN